MHCGVQSFTSCAEVFMMVQKSSKDTGLLHMMEKNLSGAVSLQRKETTAAKKMHETATNSPFSHTKCTRI